MIDDTARETGDEFSLSADAAAVNTALMSQIADEISRQGVMPFDRFMELALYAPGLGYYTAGSQKFGREGDFVTAPEISPVFSQCLANQCVQILSLTGGSILEFGAGSGVMAADILLHLQAEGTLPDEYLILDLSPELQHRQRATIAEKIPQMLSRVRWLESLPEAGFKGVILANEVLDAMPVQIFRKTEDGIEEQFVGLDADKQLKPQWQPASTPLWQAVERLEQRLGAFLPGYTSELNLRLSGWVQAIADRLEQGVLLCIDYGYSGFEYYHPERGMGTLICHYQHQAHDDPFRLAGLQDITANVDFSAVAEAGRQAGLGLAGYTTQAHFLLSNGLEKIMENAMQQGEDELSRLAQGVKILLLPTEMGERFKVIGLTKKLSEALNGFSMRDFSDRL